MYGPSTVRQIIDGYHVKRGENVHLITLHDLFIMHQEGLFEGDAESYQGLEQVAIELSDACVDGEKIRVNKANAKMLETIESLGILKKMEAFHDTYATNPMFRVMRHYMRMVVEMMAFIKSVRTGDWELHLTSVELFTKYFFSHDRLNYARMIPVYQAEMV